MRRGDLVTVSLPGAYGKPRPAVVIQSDKFNGLDSVTLLPVTGKLVDNAPLLRVLVEPDDVNGLKKPSHVMVDKTHTLPRDKIGDPFGRLDDKDLLKISRTLAMFLGIA